MDDGMPLLTIASKFMESAEFQSLYGANPTNAQFVANLYTNALHRPSQQDAGSAAGWVDQLSTNAVSRAQALVNFSESAENKASVLPVISGGITYATAAQATGPAKGQSFAGTPNADSLIGTVGNDTFTGGAGNDTIEGGKGLDTAVYGGAKASHTVIRTATGLTVASGSDGTDTLTNVERLKFDDAILAMDTAGNAGQTYRLYQAAFNRTPDKPGLSDWVKGMDPGLTLTQMATAFIGSGEFKDKYGANPTNAQFVDLLYANALHRARTVGDDYWTHQLDSGVTREQALIGFSESAENQASLIGVIQNGIELLVG
jgi:Ca2+-binding RTX toxin-like protein